MHVELTNCYGIRELKTDFDFSDSRAYAIYAPNGAMKTSFAKTFENVSLGAVSKDRIYPNRKCKRIITDENGKDVPAGSVFVVSPYDAVFGHTEKTSLLLVNDRLRKEYEELNATIVDSEALFLKTMKEQSGSKKDLKREISSTFTRSNDQFYNALTRVLDEVSEQNDCPWSEVKYDIIFDDKVLAVLENKDLKHRIGSTAIASKSSAVFRVT
jgi:hypothetical protein